MLFVCAESSAQAISPSETNFISPIKHTLKISGTFGELRSNHFHSGIDIKSSNGTSGDPIVCVEDGFVSRIKIQLSGYGKALYIDHPNGYTSVYGHLKNFHPSIEAFIRDQQYAAESYTLDIYLNENEFTFSQGDTIAIMGNSGRSYGPHVHFEIRNTATEEPINPYIFDILPQDKVRPTIKNVMIYSMDDKKNTLKQVRRKAIKSGNRYTLKNNTIEVDGWRAGIGVESYDFMDDVWNKNGVYKYSLWVDDSLHYSYEFDQFSFDQSRYLNSCIDYSYKSKKSIKLLRFYKEPGNKLTSFSPAGQNGVFPVFLDKPRNVKIITEDFNQNKSELNFLVTRKAEVSEQAADSYNYLLLYNQENIIGYNGCTISIPDGSVYNDMGISMSVERTSSSEDYMDIQFGKKSIPLHRYVTIEIDITSIPDSLRSKLCLQYVDGGKSKSFGGTAQGNKFVVSTNRMGKYKLTTDTMAPTITSENKSYNKKPGSRLKYKISDNFTVLGSAAELALDVYIDGMWTLSSYDLKYDTVFVHLPENLQKGSHLLLMKVTDHRGNTKKIEKTIQII